MTNVIDMGLFTSLIPYISGISVEDIADRKSFDEAHEDIRENLKVKVSLRVPEELIVDKEMFNKYFDIITIYQSASGLIYFEGIFKDQDLGVLVGKEFDKHVLGLKANKASK